MEEDHSAGENEKQSESPSSKTESSSFRGLPSQESLDVGNSESSLTGSQSFSPFARTLREDEVTYRLPSTKRVRHLVLGAVLGRGSYGKVREAIKAKKFDGKKWKESDLLAVKILKRKRLRKIPKGEASLESELRVLETLPPSKYVVGFFEWFENVDEKIYIVYEYMTYGSLHDIVMNLREHGTLLPEAIMRMFFRDLTKGLRHLQKHGVVHRDIKPGNLLISADGFLKISDFGVAHLISDLEAGETPDAPGSPAFQSPEVALGSTPNASADVWAAGITLFFMATGEFPFSGTSVYNLFENISDCRYDIPSHVNESLSDLIRSILNKDELERFSLDQIAEHQWMTVESTSINRLTDFKSLPDVHCLPSMFLDNDGNVLRGSGGGDDFEVDNDRACFHCSVS